MHILLAVSLMFLKSLYENHTVIFGNQLYFLRHSLNDKEHLVFILVTLFPLNLVLQSQKYSHSASFQRRRIFHSKSKQFESHDCRTMCPTLIHCFNGAGLVTKCEANHSLRVPRKIKMATTTTESVFQGREQR